MTVNKFKVSGLTLEEAIDRVPPEVWVVLREYLSPEHRVLRAYTPIELSHLDEAIVSMRGCGLHYSLANEIEKLRDKLRANEDITGLRIAQEKMGDHS